jgi:hypothetical protein
MVPPWVRWRAAVMQAAARRGPLTVESTPPKLPTGVLTALTTTALCPDKGKR